MQEPTRRGRRGRLVRELLPIGAAAGAAALAVTIVVGGTTAELVSPVQQGPWPVATSPVPTAPPPVVTNAPAPRRSNDRARAAVDLGVELAAGPVALVTGSLAGPRPALGNAAAGTGRPVTLGPPASAPSGDLELAAPPVVAIVAPGPVAPVATTPDPTMATATAPTGPGKSASAKGRALKPAPPRRDSGEAVAVTTLTAAGAASGSAAVDPAQGDDHGQGRGNGPESPPGQARAAERSSKRSQAR